MKKIMNLRGIAILLEILDTHFVIPWGESVI